MWRWSWLLPASGSSSETHPPKVATMIGIDAHGLTDTGLARQHNEDCFAIDEERKLYVVADGMGGHSHGEVASKLSVDSICEFVTRNGDATPSPHPWDDALRPHSNLLRGAILSAQRRVLRAIEGDLSLSGMGTTVVGLMVQDDVGAVAHVGDSRIYRARKGTFELLTQDHTWVNEQVMAGYLSDEQARTHPLRNVVTRALGGEAEVDIDLQEVTLENGDVFLLCSDGLTGMLRDEEILSVLQGEPDLNVACQTLIDAANARGGSDNITAVIVACATSD